MATILKEYMNMQAQFDTNIAQLTAMDLITSQEINYRIGVLKTASQFSKSTPVTMDVKALGAHYQIVDGFIKQLEKERKCGPRADEKNAKERETAAMSLSRVAESHRQGFKKFMPENERSYQSKLKAMFDAFLPVWVQYRNTYINIPV